MQLIWWNKDLSLNYYRLNNILTVYSDIRCNFQSLIILKSVNVAPNERQMMKGGNKKIPKQIKQLYFLLVHCGFSVLAHELLHYLFSTNVSQSRVTFVQFGLLIGT
jgi:hypothetical protein